MYIFSFEGFWMLRETSRRCLNKKLHFLLIEKILGVCHFFQAKIEKYLNVVKIKIYIFLHFLQNQAILEGNLRELHMAIAPPRSSMCGCFVSHPIENKSVKQIDAVRLHML